MEDNTCEEFTIKIKWLTDTCLDNGIRKFKDTNLPLNGKYEDEDEDVYYYKNGKCHNENGPAFIRKNGYKAHYINNKLHRIDGPAQFFDDGYYNWWINGYKISNETIVNWLKENDIPLDYKTWPDSDKMMFALRWSDYSE